MAEENEAGNQDTSGAPDIDDTDRLLADEQNPAQGGARGGGTDAHGVGADLIDSTSRGENGDAAETKDDDDLGGSGGFSSAS